MADLLLPLFPQGLGLDVGQIESLFAEMKKLRSVRVGDAESAAEENALLVVENLCEYPLLFSDFHVFRSTIARASRSAHSLNEFLTYHTGLRLACKGRVPCTQTFMMRKVRRAISDRDGTRDKIRAASKHRQAFSAAEDEAFFG